MSSEQNRKPTSAVVFASYRIPVSRLLEHFQWNDAIYRAYGDRLRVYVVTDKEHDLPSYAECVIVPEYRLPMLNGRPVFSLSLMKNEGIRRAIDDGADRVACTDVDIAFEGAGLAALFCVDDSLAAIPVYRMAESFEKRCEGRIDQGCTGTVAMMAVNWQRIRFEEKCFGYGAEDGVLLRDIERAGLSVDRKGHVAHIAHVAGDGERVPGNGADTCWNRANAFNPDRFMANRKFHDERKRKHSAKPKRHIKHARET